MKNLKNKSNNMKILLLFSFIFNTFISSAVPTVDEMREEIISQKLKFPLIVLAQSILECGWEYDSYNARVRSNFFGLWDSNNKKYFEFETWQLSVTGYKNMIQYRYKKGENYYDFLNRIGYAESCTYIADLKWIVRKLKNKYGIKKKL